MFAGFGAVQLFVMVVMAVAPLVLAIWVVVQIVAIRRALESIAHTLDAAVTGRGL